MQPHQVMFWYAPFSLDQNGNENSRDFTLYMLRHNLQEAHKVKSKFFVTLQTWGTKNGDTYEGYYTPPSAGINAETMAALAHGARGIFYELYYSYYTTAPYYVEGLVDPLVNGSFARRPNWFKVQEIASRLNGTLGKTLMTLTYDETGNDNGYLRLYPISTHMDMDDKTTPFVNSKRYLTLASARGIIVNFHTGFFKCQFDNNYFLLANLITTQNKSVVITVTPPEECAGYNNYRFRNIEQENNFDVTFNNSYTTSYDFPAGEGYLFQVAPVVKYGGKLYYDETITTAQTLRDDMIIESGVTLTVDANYDCYANIYIKGSGKIKTVNGGTIKFYNGRGIIAEAYPQLAGTSEHKLTLDFCSENSGSGVQLLQNTKLIMNYCILKNAVNLVSSNLPQFQMSINYCDFQNTSGYAVSLSGTSTRVPGINYCTFTNTDYGIFGAGQSSFTISHNTFTDNKLAINLSQVSSPQIIGNTISSGLNSDPGIQLISCGGNIRANTVSGHSIGISLANSSPQIGDNQIEDNYVNGIYVGAGSSPDLRGVLVGTSPNKYPISGYNLIQENGGYGTGDGSEIYFEKGNIQMDGGCNYIADDRTPSPSLTTLYLMNGEITSDGIQASDNAWGDTVSSVRFGSLTVDFTPYNYMICPLPESGDMLILSDNDGNILDTLYSAGTPSHTPTETDLQYSEAEEYMISRDYSSADVLYNTILSNSPGSVNSQRAYLSLYKSKRLQNADSSSLAALREMYTANLGSITDSVMKKVVSQLSLLSLVNERQYPEAINGFVDIILENPETEEAVFAEIDAMTTSLLAGNSNDTTLGKGLAKGLLVKGFKDYQERVNQVIHQKFGVNLDAEDNQIIPTQYSLYNNFPNPFNPTTVIRFDIPERTNVELVVYDILGRKIKSLVNNEARNPGRY